MVVDMQFGASSDTDLIDNIKIMARFGTCYASRDDISLGIGVGLDIGVRFRALPDFSTLKDCLLIMVLRL